MLKGGPLDRHHFLPKSRGGRDARAVHKICHRQLHAIWTNRELELMTDPGTLRQHPKFQPFLKWIANKHPDTYERTLESSKRRKRHG